VLEDAGRHLGVAVAGLVNLVNPEVIVLGGQLAKVGSIITTPMRASLERCAIPSAAASVVVRFGQLDTDADVVGALVAATSLLPSGESALALSASTS
jgi:predicted NBD/HSP70 family sugar kinase